MIHIQDPALVTVIPVTITAGLEKLGGGTPGAPGAAASSSTSKGGAGAAAPMVTARAGAGILAVGVAAVVGAL